ncbi:hypothetical protein [Marinobacter sp.]|uniref:hypothetical protein n=1 Tax=Marinobacter sp. TaxID=50741 RepID=UPI003A8CA7A9
MATIELKEELHANTRRTRITYRALIDGQEVAIKCYRKPLFGLIHWLRALRRGKKIRRAGGPVPPVAFSGWFPPMSCFAFGTKFLDGYVSLRDALTREQSLDRRLEMVRMLGLVVGDLHRRGIVQPDGNLTNFLIRRNADIAMVDEDDVQVYSAPLPRRLAISNLGNIAARLPNKEMVKELLAGYMDKGIVPSSPEWDDGAFWTSVEEWRVLLHAKRVSRNIAARDFD